MYKRFLYAAMLLTGSVQAQVPAEQTQSSKAELEEFARGCAAVYLMVADTATGDDLSQAMVRGASTVDYYRHSTGRSQAQVNSDITDMRARLSERLAQTPHPDLKTLRANCDAAFAPAGG
jgi:hypothetical protein